MVYGGMTEGVIDSNCLENGNYISKPFVSKPEIIMESRFIDRHYRSQESKNQRRCTIGRKPDREIRRIGARVWIVI